jgi:hypothetical protein
MNEGSGRREPPPRPVPSSTSYCLSTSQCIYHSIYHKASRLSSQIQPMDEGTGRESLPHGQYRAQPYPFLLSTNPHKPTSRLLRTRLSPLSILPSPPRRKRLTRTKEYHDITPYGHVLQTLRPEDSTRMVTQARKCSTPDTSVKAWSSRSGH